MANGIVKFLKKIEPEHGTLAHTLFDGFFTFAFTPDETTKPEGVQIRDGMDLKRLMFHVVIALQLCYVFGTYNVGHQHFVALGEYTGFMEGFFPKLAFGLVKLLPLFIVSNLVGLGVEFYYAYKKGHAIEEGFLVSGALIPLIMPPDLPLWILAMSIIFAVVIGKEAFGGTGMNILNIALLARVFVFFAYPTTISGDEVWVAGFDNKAVVGATSEYGFAFNWIVNPLFEMLGLDPFVAGKPIVDGWTGATPLGLAAKGGWEAVTNVYSESQMFWGAIPGSIGETSAPFILFGTVFLIVTKVADWRIIVSGIIGCIVMGMILNAWGATPFMEVPWADHLIMGSFLFAITFMATDPVSAASTPTGKWIYGFLIGALGLIIRVLNPAYPEGWMLAILFMNVFAPLIDHYVLEANISRRLKRATA
jgi:Na+-transporting NADH:ubiquinone oxidoreductase subunit B